MKRTPLVLIVVFIQRAPFIKDNVSYPQTDMCSFVRLTPLF